MLVAVVEANRTVTLGEIEAELDQRTGVKMRGRRFQSALRDAGIERCLVGSGVGERFEQRQRGGMDTPPPGDGFWLSELSDRCEMGLGGGVLRQRGAAG